MNRACSLGLLTAAALLAACGGRARPAEAPAVAADTAADAPPGTDVFFADLTLGDDTIGVGRPINFTQRAGYDNQPAFTPDGSVILYTSVRDDSQADIYRYDIDGGYITRITRTPESEYSAAVTPAGDGLSVVQVEADSTQRLWRFDLEGGGPSLILEGVDSVGYYAWGSAGTLALFVLGSPPTLRLADAGTGTAETVAADIGRSLQKMPDRDAVSFVHKVANDEWWIRELDVATGDTSSVVLTLPGAEDHAWAPDGTLLMAQGSTLYAWREGETVWRPIRDFADDGLREIGRLAVSPDGDWIAIVAADQTGETR